MYQFQQQQLRNIKERHTELNLKMSLIKMKRHHLQSLLLP